MKEITNVKNILYLTEAALSSLQKWCVELRHFFEDGERGKNPPYSIYDYQDNNLKYVPQCVSYKI